MSIGDRLHRVAVRGCVTLAAFSWLACESNAQQQQRATPPSEQTQNYTARPAPVTVVGPVAIEREQPIETDWNRPKCGSAQSHDEADLCEQRRMAKAAEKAVDWAGWQLYVAVVGTFFLIWNLVYARRATDAAVKAAQAAEKAVEVTSDTARRELRAYVGVIEGYVENLVPGAIPRAVVLIKNSGQTPAYKVAATTTCAAGRFPPDRTFDVNPPENADFRSPINPGEGYTVFSPIGKQITAQQIELIEAGEGAIWAFGAIRYMDAFDEPRVTTFRLILIGEDGSLNERRPGKYVMTEDKDGNDAT
jgi:hypothetical protein